MSKTQRCGGTKIVSSSRNQRRQPKAEELRSVCVLIFLRAVEAGAVGGVLVGDENGIVSEYQRKKIQPVGRQNIGRILHSVSHG